MACRGDEEQMPAPTPYSSRTGREQGPRPISADSNTREKKVIPGAAQSPFPATPPRVVKYQDGRPVVDVRDMK